MGNDRCGPSAFHAGKAKRLLSVAPALRERSEPLKVHASHARGLKPHAVLGVQTCGPRLHAPLQQLGCPAQSPMA